MSSPEIILFWENLFWLRTEWSPKFQLLRTLCGNEITKRKIRNYGGWKIQKITTLMTVQEQLQYIATLEPFFKENGSSMYSSRSAFSVNSTLVPPKARRSCEVHLAVQKLDKNNVLVIPPPPGFLVAPQANCAYCLNAVEGFDIEPSEDLDINSLIEEFKAESKVHEEYETVFFLRNFLIDHFLNSKFAKEHGTADTVHEYLQQSDSLEKIAEVTCEFLKRFGFDALFLRLQCASVNFLNKLAIEVCCNEMLSSEVVSACNMNADRKKRMSYTNYF